MAENSTQNQSTGNGPNDSPPSGGDASTREQGAPPLNQPTVRAASSDRGLERYPGQPPEELTLHVFHKHWAAVAPFIFVSILFMAACLAGIYIGARWPLHIQNVPNNLLSLVSMLLFFVAVFMFAAIIWIWRHNHVLITDEHLVDVDQQGLFHKRVSTLSLNNVQDVSSQIEGLLQTVLKYGNVVVQTAGERENFVLDYLPQPAVVEQCIIETHNKFRAQYKPPATPDAGTGS